MTPIAAFTLDFLWRNALGAIPLAIAVAVICRFINCRPSTRHALWFIVLLALLAPPMLPALDFSDDLGTPRFFAELSQAREKENPATLFSEDSALARPQALPDAVGRHRSMANSPHAATADSSQQPSTRSKPSVSLDQIPASPQLTMPEIAASTASDRSPTVLRPSAGHPVSSAHPRDAKHSEAGSTATHVSSAKTPANQPPVMTSAIPLAVAPFTRWIESAAHPNPQAAMQARIALAGSASNALPPSLLDSGSSIMPRSAVDATAIEWRNWLARVGTARDSVVSLAPIPITLWVAGVALILLVMLVRVWRFRHLLQSAWPAEGEVVALVQECADAIGLRIMPHVLMTDRPVSPLVWCGVRRVLLLPSILWEDLDDTGRRTVLLHELAHLKRRDHWVCWIEMVACTLYWWNPMAWWVRHRIRDEADYCCDAWVTAVLPQSRTAYARALVTTRQYLSLNPSRAVAPTPPGMALGATSARTKRFARRLTMVMTDRSTPRLSTCGSALALCLIAGAWLATPLWACPPEETSGGPSASAVAAKQAAEQKAKAKSKAAKAPKAGKSDVKVPYAVVAPSPPAGSTYEQHMADRGSGSDTTVAQAAPSVRGQVRSSGGGSAGGDGMESRIDRLESRMDRLASQLERLIESGNASRSGAPAFRTAEPKQPSPPAPPAPPARPNRAASPAEPSPPAPPARLRTAVRGQAPEASSTTSGFARTTPAPDVDGELIISFYPLPEGKAEALFELMRREDIPVLVAPRDNGIEVHGTASQHRVFSAFIKLIHPEARIEGMRAPQADVEQHAAALRDAERRAALTGELALTKGQMEEARAQLEHARAQAQRQQKTQAEQARRSLDQQRKQLEQQRDRMRKQVEELQREAEKLQRESEKLRNKAEKMKDSAEKDQLAAKADAMEAQADALEARADAQEEQFDAQIEDMEAQMEAQADAMEAEFEAMQEAMEAELEARMEELETLMAAADAKAKSTPAPSNPR